MSPHGTGVELAAPAPHATLALGADPMLDSDGTGLPCGSGSSGLCAAGRKSVRSGVRGVVRAPKLSGGQPAAHGLSPGPPLGLPETGFLQKWLDT